MNNVKFAILKSAKRGHKLLTKELESKLPALYATDGDGPLEEKTIYVKYFSPCSNYTWYAAEYSPVERLFFGLVKGHESEWGYFSLDELESMGGAVERDLYFSPTKVKDL